MNMDKKQSFVLIITTSDVFISIQPVLYVEVNIVGDFVMFMTVKEIANKLKTNVNCVRTWLDGYKFTKYRIDERPIKYEINDCFWQDLYDFLKTKKSYKAFQNIKVLCKSED